MQPVVHLLSNWYSGATLLARLLDQHDAVMCNGETFPFGPHDIRKYQCSCGETIDTCAFYQFAASHMKESELTWDRPLFSQIPTYSNTKTINRLLVSARLDSYIRNSLISFVPRYARERNRYLGAHKTFIENALQFTGKSFYVDGTKSIGRAQLFARSNDFHCVGIYLVRDPRGFCRSFLRHNELTNDDIGIAVSRWNYYVRKMMSLRRLFGDGAWHVVLYEDLCRDMEATMREIFKFIGVAPDGFRFDDAGDSHILGNRMRLRPLVSIEEDLSWQEVFDQQTADRILRDAGSLARQFGYTG